MVNLSEEKTTNNKTEYLSKNILSEYVQITSSK
jgi:hypothetical protein